MYSFKRIINALLKRLPVSYYPYKPFMHKYNCIFIHIPKNAGSSVLAAFNDNNGRKHAKWYDFLEANEYFYKRYYKFSIVREPLTRLFSAYKYALKGGNNSYSDQALSLYIKERCSCFSSFIDNVLCADFVMQQPLFTPQYLYIFNRQLQCEADSIIYYESLATDWQRVTSELGCLVELPWKNASNGDSMPVLPPHTLKKVSDIYCFDYKLLNYDDICV